MSILSSQADELRKTANMAANLDDFERVSVPWMRNKLAPMLREAADTIESLRNSLTASEAALNKAAGKWAKADLQLRESYGQVPEQGERENNGERESYSRWDELFGTPERAAETLKRMDVDVFNWCVDDNGNHKNCGDCPYEYDYYGCYLPDGFSLLEWLREDCVHHD